MANDTGCNTTHQMTVLSFLTAGISVILLVLTFILNILLFIALTRNRERLKKYMFYKMLLNICVADLLTSLISDTSSISFHTKEGLRHHITKFEVVVLHCGLFVINGVSILTLALLCVDRVIALLKTTLYIEGMSARRGNLLILLTWVCSCLLCTPYLFIGYIRYLTIFSGGTVTIAFVSLMVTALVYRQRLKPKKTLSQTASNQQQTNDYNLKARNVAADGIHEAPVPNGHKSLSKLNSSENRVTQSFLIMLIVFLITYLPASVMTLYMNLCKNCNCIAIHILRDLTYLAILSSALWRPLNFILRLKTVRNDIKRIFSNGRVVISDDRGSTSGKINSN